MAYRDPWGSTHFIVEAGAESFEVDTQSAQVRVTTNHIASTELAAMGAKNRCITARMSSATARSLAMALLHAANEAEGKS